MLLRVLFDVSFTPAAGKGSNIFHSRSFNIKIKISPNFLNTSLNSILLIKFRIMNLSNILKYTKKAKLHLQNVSTKFHLQTLHDGCQLNGKQIFFIKLLIKILFQL